MIVRAELREQEYKETRRGADARFGFEERGAQGAHALARIK